MYSNNKEIRDVADVAARIMAGLPPLQEKLHPNQQRIDVVDDEKIDGKDFAKLRAGKKPDVKKEEVEQIDELSTSTLKSYISGAQKDRASQSDSKNSGDRAEADYAKKQIVKRTSGIVDAKSRMSKEEVEIEEESHQSKTTMKHIPNASPALKQAAKDIKPGVGGYRDRIAMLKAGGVKEEVELDEVAAWQRKEGKNPEGGLNQKGIASYRAENPGSKLSTAVTTEPSKLKVGSKAANRRKSFCARMSGMKRKLTSAKTASDPDSRINKSLRKWNC